MRAGPNVLNGIRSAKLNCQSESIADACKVDEHGAWNDQDVDVSHLGVSFIHRVQSVARSCPRVKSELNPQFTPSTKPGAKEPEQFESKWTSHDTYKGNRRFTK